MAGTKQEYPDAWKQPYCKLGQLRSAPADQMTRPVGHPAKRHQHKCMQTLSPAGTCSCVPPPPPCCTLSGPRMWGWHARWGSQAGAGRTARMMPAPSKGTAAGWMASCRRLDGGLYGDKQEGGLRQQTVMQVSAIHKDDHINSITMKSVACTAHAFEYPEVAGESCRGCQQKTLQCWHAPSAALPRVNPCRTYFAGTRPRSVLHGPTPHVSLQAYLPGWRVPAAAAAAGCLAAVVAVAVHAAAAAA